MSIWRWLQRYPWIAAVVPTLVACALCVSVYPVFGHTWDEPEHIAAGIDLLDRGEYVYDDQHPPLGRLAAAIGPYLAGARSHGRPGPSGETEGRVILYESTTSYDTLLTLARLGMLPFLAILIMATWLWAQRRYGAPVAAFSALFLISTPAILGHAAVAAIDVPVTALIILSLHLLLRWFETPSWRHGLMLGLAMGLAFATKLSAVPFIAVPAVVLIAARVALVSRLPLQPGRRLWTAAVAAGAILGVVVGVYGPSRHLLTTPDFMPSKALNLLSGKSGWLHDQVYRIASRVPLPLGVEKFPLALLGVEWHNTVGHSAYLLGETSRLGWWYFYPVALAVKTPLPLLLLGATGLVLLAVRGWRERNLYLMAPSLCFAAILVFACAYSHINIGVRHVLVLYPLLAMAAAYALVLLWQRSRKPWIAALLVALASWQLATTVIAYPDYLAYFNVTAGSHPERILVDSDLDWGQDLRRLGTTLQQRHIRAVYIAFRGNADLARENLPSYQLLRPNQPVTGWVAIDLLSEMEGSPGYDWLRRYSPVQRVGKSIDLYFIPAS